MPPETDAVYPQCGRRERSADRVPCYSYFLKKLFNIREGWQNFHDTLPSRIFESSNTNESNQNNNLTREELNTMISSYYKARGWTKTGTIPKSKIQELSLDYVLQN